MEMLKYHSEVQTHLFTKHHSQLLFISGRKNIPISFISVRHYLVIEAGIILWQGNLERTFILG